MFNILSQITLKVKFLRNKEQHCLLPSLVDDFTVFIQKNALLTHILSTLFSSTSVLFSCTPFGTKSFTNSYSYNYVCSQWTVSLHMYLFCPWTKCFVCWMSLSGHDQFSRSFIAALNSWKFSSSIFHELFIWSCSDFVRCVIKYFDQFWYIILEVTCYVEWRWLMQYYMLLLLIAFM